VKRILLVGVSVAVLWTGSLYAEQFPRSGGYDQHIKLVAYNPLNVVRVTGSPTNSTEIIFSSREEITQVSIGDADSWLAQPSGNLLFIKPTKINISTNMTVVTKTVLDEKRSYQFQLLAIARKDDGATEAIYALGFTYPEDDRRSREQSRMIANTIATERATEARLANTWMEGPRNWHYIAQGSKKIQPTEVSDNGRQTAFRFPGNMRVPTIYAATPDGSETIVPYTMINDMAVIQTTSNIFTLRDGQEVLRIINQGFDPVSPNPGTGTGSTDLTRTIGTNS